jgi:hypothetical protein
MSTGDYNEGARGATKRAITKWMLAHGTHPTDRSAIMLQVVECATGKPIATGFGESDLTACNALLSDLTERCRGLLGIRRMTKTWREHLRGESEERRAEQSEAFLASRRSPVNSKPDCHSNMGRNDDQSSASNAVCPSTPNED